MARLWLVVDSVGAVFAAVVFVQPAVSHHPLWLRLAICLGWFIASSVLLLAVEHLLKVSSIVVSRLRAYNDLYDVAERQFQQIAKAQDTILELSSELTNGRRFEIIKTLYYDDTLYIEIRKNRNRRLELGHRVRVIDVQDGGIMGLFQVTEIRSDGYRARSEDVDPIWLGYVHKIGSTEGSAPPNTVAFLILGD